MVNINTLLTTMVKYGTRIEQECVPCPDIIIHPAWGAGLLFIWIVFIDFNFAITKQNGVSKHPCPVCESVGG
jgi:hypothetical protein